jgi:hypothetical protein
MSLSSGLRVVRVPTEGMLIEERDLEWILVEILGLAKSEPEKVNFQLPA